MSLLNLTSSSTFCFRQNRNFGVESAAWEETIDNCDSNVVQCCSYRFCL